MRGGKFLHDDLLLLPRLRAWFVFQHQRFERREFFGTAERLDVPRQPSPVVVVEAGAFGRAMKCDGERARGLVPERLELETGGNPVG